MRIASIAAGFGLLLGAANAQTALKLTLPQPPADGINRGQPFDRHVPDASVYQGHVYFVWGSQESKSLAPAVNSKYLPYSRDHDRKHTLEWYKANHPDWIVYKDDRSTPAYGFLYPTGNAMSLDITNPAVREWYWNSYVAPAIEEGYRMFAFDNVELMNWDKRSGHYDVHGKWVQQFSGEKVDPAYVKTVLEWMEYLTARLHAAGIGVAANITFPLGLPELMPAMRKLVETVDLWGDEQGFTKHRDSNITDEQWQQKFDFIRSMPAGKLHWAVNEMSTKHLADASDAQIDYAVANYYLYREMNSLLTVCGGQEYGGYLDTPAMDFNLGHAVAAPVRDEDGDWRRVYSDGLVMVNPQSKQGATVKLPAGVWVDSHGKAHIGKLEMPPNSGYMLRLKVH